MKTLVNKRWDSVSLTCLACAEVIIGAVATRAESTALVVAYWIAVVPATDAIVALVRHRTALAVCSCRTMWLCMESLH